MTSEEHFKNFKLLQKISLKNPVTFVLTCEEIFAKHMENCFSSSMFITINLNVRNY